jgi:gas vesicle protein
MDDATGRVGGGTGKRRRGSSVADAEPVDPTLPAETDERARELRAEIAETRVEMTETIEALQDRLKPSTIVANAGETVRNATTEKVKQMANTAGDAAERVMNNSFMDTIRENPLPAAMIGIGAAWLIIKGRSETRRYDMGRYGYDQGYGESGRYDWRTRTGGATTGQYGYGTAGSEDSDTNGGVRDMASDAASRASEYVDDARYAVRRTTRRAQNSFDRVLRENPLALGAAATIVGAAIGMTIPETEAENELMGETRDNVVERARGLASEAAQKVQDTAGQVKDVASRAAEAARPDNPPQQRPGGSR